MKVVSSTFGSLVTAVLFCAPLLAFAQNPTLPAERPLASIVELGLRVPGQPDWLAAHGDAVWVTLPATSAVGRLDLKTGMLTATVPVQRPCGPIAAGLDAVWVHSCAGRVLLRIAPNEARVTDTLRVGLANSEGAFAFEAGSIWVPSDTAGTLSRVDPRSGRVIATVQLKPHSYTAVAAFGSVWVTNTGARRAAGPGSVQRVDPTRDAVVATIETGPAPRFFTASDDALWTLNQGDGTVSRIDPRTNRVVATIPVGVAGGGGDIAAGGGFVWVRATKTLLSVIDPRTNSVVARFGPPAGSGAVRVAGGSVWISAHDVDSVWRVRSTP